MDAKTTGRKVVGEQDIHTDSKYCPTDYLLITRESFAFVKEKSSSYHNNPVIKHH